MGFFSNLLGGNKVPDDTASGLSRNGSEATSLSGGGLKTNSNAGDTAMDKSNSLIKPSDQPEKWFDEGIHSGWGFNGDNGINNGVGGGLGGGLNDGLGGGDTWK